MYTQLGWTQHCCICGADAVCYNNPDPIRDVALNCCNECNNLLVCEARTRLFRLPEGQQKAYIDALQKMSYEDLKAELLPEPEKAGE